MDIRFKPSRAFLKAVADSLKSLFLLLFILFIATLTGCKKDFDYTPYISELRSNVLLAKTENFALRIYAVYKENPYHPDGIPREGNTRIEVHLTAPDGKETYHLYFTFDGREFGGEMSYDSVKAEYFFSCTLDISKAETLPCRIEYDGNTITLNARSILQENTLSAKEVLTALQTAEGELFSSLTDKYGFAGEIHIRLIYEENPYYYVGVIDRNGKVNAFLLNAQTGKVLAKRES
jgi:hypothetical protein